MQRFLPVVLLPLAILALACSPPSADDLVQEVLRQRQNYEARLSSWIIRDSTSPPHLYLDVNVINNNQDATLDQLTVMVEQLDSEDNVLSAQRVPIDASELTPGISESKGIEVSPAVANVDGVRLYIEGSPDPEVWNEFPELDAVRPRI